MQTYNALEGFHKWSKAPTDIAFLRDRHRHIFEIRCKFKVDHADRALEIIQTQHLIESFLTERFGRPCEFGERSCEAIAELLSRTFDACEVSVLEDGFGGGLYTEEAER
ncbi:MAG: hypothetical protein PUB60_08775 [Veillonellaceae bacterium]|nr:hypothetical protein [Veillonellaceae bacterium]